MTSVVDKYYRKISENIDNLKMKFDISALLVKTKEHDSLINTNKTDISDNSNLINTNKTDISDNLNLINTNKTDISDNSNLINTNKNIISDNSNLINTNKNNISDNSNLINTNKTDITKINNDLTNLKDGYKLKDIIVFNITNTDSKAVSKNNPSFVIFNDNINSFIKKDSFLEINTSIRTIFLLHYINVGYFDVKLEIYDDKNQLISSTKMPLMGMISKQAIVSTICYVKLSNDYNSINLQLSIQIQENQNRNDIIKILEFDNFVYVKIFEKLDNSIYYEEFDV